MPKIIDLTPELEGLYLNCLTDDREWISETGDGKRAWYEAMKPRGLRVKLALDEEGRPEGMVQYLPVEESFVKGRDLLFLYCIWVMKDERRGVDRQGRGVGSALLDAFEEDARKNGKKGTAAWGVTFPGFMRADWFEGRGYAVADVEGVQALLWKAWDASAPKPAWTRALKKPEADPRVVKVAAYRYGWCPEINKAFERAKLAAADLGPGVSYEEYDTKDERVMREWGITDALFIDGVEIPLGPAPSRDSLEAAMKASMARKGVK